MPNPEMQTLLDHVKRELENVVFSPPEWVADRLTHKMAGAIAKAIPKGFADSIHEVIEKLGLKPGNIPPRCPTRPEKKGRVGFAKARCPFCTAQGYSRPLG